MITAAVTAGRIVHPCVIGVYDAVDEGERAFVVREWVDGVALRDAVREGLLDPGRAASIARTAADALASIHAAGHTHGNLHPGTVLLGDDEITLTELRLDPTATQQADVRAIGGLLYAALTGHWPHELPPHQVGLPDAVRVDGRLLSPRQVRAGIPGYLDALTMDLLDPSVAAPPAIELATELRRYDVADPDLGPLTALAPEPAPRPSRLKRFLVPVAGVLCIGAAGWVVGTAFLPEKGPGYGDDGNPRTSKSPAPPAVTAPYKPQGVRILDPGGDGGELKNADRAIDGKLATEWRTDRYEGSAKFGNIENKKGMGVLVDLGESKPVRHVTVQLSAPGATVELRAGDVDAQQPEAYGVVVPPRQNAPQVVKFDLQEAANERYVLVWITSLPEYRGGYAVGVKEITVTG
jgi:hypothetical protein